MWFPKKGKTMENPNHPVVMDEHDLVVKAMVTWGSPILRIPVWCF